MEVKKTTRFLVFLIVGLSTVATLSGIISNQGPGEYDYESIRGQSVKIYGKGIYQHMSADVAIQGIAQDYVTLFIGVPLLLISLFWAARKSLKGGFLLAGTLGYFFVTYLFYLCMGMFNALFLFYVILTSLSFFTLILTLLSFKQEDLSSHFHHSRILQLLGGFLIFNSIAIGMMWLSVILPPLINGTVYPLALEHYTTLIVQGLDLSLLLPCSFLAGALLIKKKALGYLLAPVYIIFLSILMTALTAKVIGMTIVGANAGPALVIIPAFALMAILFSIAAMKNIK